MSTPTTSSLFIAPIQNKQLSGTITIPSSKSHSIRSLLLTAMAEGTSTIDNILLSGDTLSCIDVLKAWGVQTTVHKQSITIHSPGLHNLYFNKNNNQPITINVGNSGTTLYLVTALAALGNRTVYFTGDSSIQKRSAKELLIALQQLGITIEYHNTNNTYCAPYSITGPIQAGTVFIHCPTSQYLSALLIALSFLPQTSIINTDIDNELPYVDMTLQWLEQFHVPIQNIKYKTFTIQGSPIIQNFNTTISGDYSSAAFFICAAALYNNTITITGLNKNDIQADKKVIDILSDMGVIFDWKQDSHGSWILSRNIQNNISLPQLNGGIFNLKDMPDSLPILAICACFAKNPTTLTGIAHARIKETDRIAIMAKELTNTGVKCKEHTDGITIYPSQIQGGTVYSHGDHRIAMAFSIAALGSYKGITIKDYTVANITYPNFYTTLEKLGATCTII